MAKAFLTHDVNQLPAELTPHVADNLAREVTMYDQRDLASQDCPVPCTIGSQLFRELVSLNVLPVYEDFPGQRDGLTAQAPNKARA
ncbi:hypothetical protein [Arthrobacter sp. K5]|uniref:Uncharacterized protein n=1 Tax=Arthrobacter sp. K5 TaxID=2839623 RepID=A0AAU8EN28_9MICC